MPPLNQRQRYSVDLQGYIAECEANYLRLLKLAPFEDDDILYKIDGPNNQEVSIQFSVTERCKYTTMMLVKQEGGGEWLNDSLFELRVYHDAQMVEVVGYQKHRRVKPCYPYPNNNMYQRDEKFQQHRFLSECLANCLKNGLSETSLYVV